MKILLSITSIGAGGAQQIGPSVLERFGLDTITGARERLLQQAAAS